MVHPSHATDSSRPHVRGVYVGVWGGLVWQGIWAHCPAVSVCGGITLTRKDLNCFRSFSSKVSSPACLIGSRISGSLSGLGDVWGPQ